MIGAEVVDGADQVHSVVKCRGAAGQGSTPAGERRQALAEGGIEPFDVSGVDHASAALRAAAELFDLRCRAGPQLRAGRNTRTASPVTRRFGGGKTLHKIRFRMAIVLSITADSSSQKAY